MADMNRKDFLVSSFHLGAAWLFSKIGNAYTESLTYPGQFLGNRIMMCDGLNYDPEYTKYSCIQLAINEVEPSLYTVFGQEDIDKHGGVRQFNQEHFCKAFLGLDYSTQSMGACVSEIVESVVYVDGRVPVLKLGLVQEGKQWNVLMGGVKRTLEQYKAALEVGLFTEEEWVRRQEALSEGNESINWGKIFKVLAGAGLVGGVVWFLRGFAREVRDPEISLDWQRGAAGGSIGSGGRESEAWDLGQVTAAHLRSDYGRWFGKWQAMASNIRLDNQRQELSKQYLKYLKVIERSHWESEVRQTAAGMIDLVSQLSDQYRTR